MNRLSILSFLIVAFVSISSAQFPSALLKQVRQLKLLESKRGEVERLLTVVALAHTSEHFQRFASDDADVLVYYSSGTCSDDPDDEDASGSGTLGRGASLGLRSTSTKRRTYATSD